MFVEPRFPLLRLTLAAAGFAALLLSAHAQEDRSRAPLARSSSTLVSPAVTALFADGTNDDGQIVVIHLQPERDDRPLVPAATATMESDGIGGLRYTLNGRAVDEADLAAHAQAAKRQLVARAAEREARDEARLTALLAASGLSRNVIDRSATSARVRVTAAQLESLAAAGAHELRRIDVARETSNTLTNALTTNPQGALEWLKVIPFAHSYGLKGQGIGIWTGEGGSPDPNDSEINPSKLVFLTGDAASEHSTWTTTLLQKTAPLATVYYGHQPVGCHILSSIQNQTNPPVYLGSNSWNWPDTTTGTYGDCAAEWDDFVYTSRIGMFVPSGGNMLGTFTTTPGKAFNVFAAGGADTSKLPLDIPWFSGYTDPETGALKPDGVTPAVCITRKAGEDCAGGVSLATPLAAAFAADLMGGSSFFLNQPQAVKAYLTAGATTDVVPGIDEDGPGMLNFLHTQFYRSGKWWNGNSTAYFNANNEIVESMSVVANKRYRVAISWLVQGSYALSTKQPNMRMELRVVGGGKTWASAYLNSTTQWVDFVAPTSGTYTIRIKRTKNSNNGQLALALTVGEVV